MKFLIIGASGFVGSRLLKTAQRAGHTAIGTATSHGTKLIHFDLRHHRILDRVQRRFFQTDEPVFAVYCSNYCGVDQCLAQRAQSYNVNVTQVKTLIDGLTSLDVIHVYLSTSYVFDGAKGDYVEDDICMPINEYGRQKLEIERNLCDSRENALVLRLGKVVDDHNETTHMFQDWYRLAEAQRPIECIEGQRLSPTLVGDVATSILTACELRLKGIYHIANRESCLRDWLAHRFLEITGGPSEIHLTTADELGLLDRRPLRADLNPSRFIEATGMRFTPIEEMIEQFRDSVRSKV